MARDGFAKAFLKDVGSAVAGGLLKAAAEKAEARGAHDSAHAFRLFGEALTNQSSHHEALQREIRDAPQGSARRAAIYGFAAQVLRGATTTSTGPDGAECFARGCKAASTAEALHWWERGAAMGDPDCRRRLAQARIQSPVRAGLPAATAAPAPCGSTDTGLRTQALEILGLREGACADDIRAAYQRLMRQVHPDKGGSDFFAKQLNFARQTLLG